MLLKAGQDESRMCCSICAHGKYLCKCWGVRNEAHKLEEQGKHTGAMEEPLGKKPA